MLVHNVLRDAETRIMKLLIQIIKACFEANEANEVTVDWYRTRMVALY